MIDINPDCKNCRAKNSVLTLRSGDEDVYAVIHLLTKRELLEGRALKPGADAFKTFVCIACGHVALQFVLKENDLEFRENQQ